MSEDKRNVHWTWYTEEELLDKSKQQEVFEKMLAALENKGMCRDVFHTLAKVLFDDPLR